ncbi:MAG: Rieske 2Fe-2S domain-containing protein [Ferruginibacter sp.]
MNSLQWHKVAASSSELFSDHNSIKEILVAKKRICVIKHNDDLYAIAAVCPHAGGSLAEGYTDALGNVVCPLHHYRFQLSSGRNISGEGYHLKTYMIESRADGIYIGL